MGKVSKHGKSFTVVQRLQPPGRAPEGCDGLIKSQDIQPHGLCQGARSSQILNVVGANEVGCDRPVAVKREGHGPIRVRRARRRLVGDELQVRARASPNDLFQRLVIRAPHHCCVWSQRLEVSVKLLDVIFLCGKDVDVVPSDARKQGELGFIPEELWPTVDGGTQVLIAFEDAP